MNKVTLMGRLTKDIEIRTSTTGLTFASFTLAVDRRGSKEKQTDFITCKAFGKTAENISNFFKKGSLIIVCGTIQTGSYEKDGNKIYTTDVMVNEFYFTGEKRDRQETSDASELQEFSGVELSDDELPFRGGNYG